VNGREDARAGHPGHYASACAFQPATLVCNVLGNVQAPEVSRKALGSESVADPHMRLRGDEPSGYWTAGRGVEAWTGTREKYAEPKHQF
jgi:hypothetical protein